MFGNKDKIMTMIMMKNMLRSLAVAICLFGVLFTGSAAIPQLNSTNVFTGSNAFVGPVSFQPGAIKPSMVATGISTNALSPLAFGAVGDGTTDDTTALQACFAAANTGQSRVIELQGLNYRVTQTLVLTNPFVEVAHGILSTTNMITLVQIQGNKDYLHDLILAGPGTNTSAGSIGVFLTKSVIADYVQAPALTRCLITNFWQGVVLSNAVGTVIESCGITANASNSVFNVASDETIIRNSVLGYAGPASLNAQWGSGTVSGAQNCIAVYSAGNLGITLESCDINFCHQGVYSYGPQQIGAVNATTIRRCNFESIFGTNYTPVVQFTNVSGIVVEGCDFGQTGLNASNTLTSISLQNCVNGNTFIAGNNWNGTGHFLEVLGNGTSGDPYYPNVLCPPQASIWVHSVYGDGGTQLNTTYGSGLLANIGANNTWFASQVFQSLLLQNDQGIAEFALGADTGATTSTVNTFKHGVLAGLRYAANTPDFSLLSYWSWQTGGGTPYTDEFVGAAPNAYGPSRLLMLTQPLPNTAGTAAGWMVDTQANLVPITGSGSWPSYVAYGGPQSIGSASTLISALYATNIIGAHTGSGSGLTNVNSLSLGPVSPSLAVLSIFGDSMSAPGNSYQWCNQLTNYPWWSGVSQTNAAVGGTQISAGTNAWWAWAPTRDTNKFNISTVWMGANDISVLQDAGGNTIYALISQMSNFVWSVNASNCHPIGFTVLNRGSGNGDRIGSKTNLNIYNDWVRSSPLFWRVVDMAALLPNNFDTSFFSGDGTHPNSNGCNVVAAELARQVAFPSRQFQSKSFFSSDGTNAVIWLPKAPFPIAIFDAANGLWVYGPIVSTNGGFQGDGSGLTNLAVGSLNGSGAGLTNMWIQREWAARSLPSVNYSTAPEIIGVGGAVAGYASGYVPTYSMKSITLTNLSLFVLGGAASMTGTNWSLTLRTNSGGTMYNTTFTVNALTGVAPVPSLGNGGGYNAWGTNNLGFSIGAGTWFDFVLGNNINSVVTAPTLITVTYLQQVNN